MSDWTAGYVADIDYTYGYYGELNPLRTRLSLLHAGIKPPSTTVACELGFGQGVSINIHAAASPSQWYGTDFNPAQAAFARELAEISGAKAHLFDQSFVEFCSRDDLPEFDYISLHGIWSWVSNENREVIVDFVRRKLKVGGVLYISYNTLPGWAAFSPMRHLLKEHALVHGTQGEGIVSKVDSALGFASELLTKNPRYLQANPDTSKKIEELKKQDKQYLAHEYFNQEWRPMYFAETREFLNSAKLSYACSAHYLDQIDTLNVTAEQQEFLSTFNDRSFIESARDFMTNQQFRRDYWVKGPRTLSRATRIDLLRKERVVLIRPRDLVSLKVTGLLGSAEMSEELYLPVLEVLANHKALTLEQIFKSVHREGFEFGTLLEIVMVLAGAGAIASARDIDEAMKVRKHCDKLNKELLSCDNFEGKVASLASPVIGGGIPINRFQKMFLFARSQGLKLPSDWAAFAWKNLSEQGQKLVVEGKTLETDDENVRELESQAKAFAEQDLLMLQALLVVA